MSKKIATREAYGKALAGLANTNENQQRLQSLRMYVQKDSSIWELQKQIWYQWLQDLLLVERFLL